MGSQDLEVRFQELIRLFHVHGVGAASTNEASRIDRVLLAKGLVSLSSTKKNIHTTALGKAHIYQILDLPLPQEKIILIDYKGDVLE